MITGVLSAPVFLLGLSLGLLSNNILVVNNYRDVETDEAAGKRTLVVRHGRAFARTQYALQLMAAYLCLSVYVGVTGNPWPGVALLTIPIGAGLIVALRTAEGAGLNELLARSARLLLVFSLLVAVGVFVSGTVA